MAGIVWNVFIVCMVGYLVKSIIEQLARDHARDLEKSVNESSEERKTRTPKEKASRGLPKKPRSRGRSKSRSAKKKKTSAKKPKRKATPKRSSRAKSTGRNPTGPCAGARGSESVVNESLSSSPSKNVTQTEYSYMLNRPKEDTSLSCS